MVRNGDAHLKNFWPALPLPAQVWLAPLFDVVTTSIYTYARSPAAPSLEDRTLALKLFAGKGRTKAHPTTRS